MTLKGRIFYREDSPYKLTEQERQAFEQLLLDDYHESWRFTVYTEDSHAYEPVLDSKNDHVTFTVGRHGLFEELSRKRFSGKLKGLEYYRTAYEELSREHRSEGEDIGILY